MFEPFPLLITVILAGSLHPQDVADPWARFKYFEGNWEGTVKEKARTGKIEREYQFVLNRRYLQVKNKSHFEPTDKNPRGELHEDIGMLSYDRIRDKFVFRDFLPEGFVNQLALDKPAPDENTLVFVSEGIENLPEGWRARMTYRIVSEDEFNESFELASPGKDFAPLLEHSLKRKK